MRTRGEEGPFQPLGAAPPDFDDPVGVASDPFGNIYVSESSGNVVTVLSDGVAVEAAEPGTFDQPGDLTITERGRVLVADGANSGTQLLYGAPDIMSVTPSLIRIDGGVAVTIQGRNLAPDSVVVVGRHLISDIQILNTSEIRFVAPVLDSGLQTLTVQHLGGIDQVALSVRPPSLEELAPGFITTIFGGGVIKAPIP